MSATTFMVPATILVLASALTIDLLRPILAPFLWAVVLSIPLHHMKYHLLTLIDPAIDGGDTANQSQKRDASATVSTAMGMRRLWTYTAKIILGKQIIGLLNSIRGRSSGASPPSTTTASKDQSSSDSIETSSSSSNKTTVHQEEEEGETWLGFIVKWTIRYFLVRGLVLAESLTVRLATQGALVTFVAGWAGWTFLGAQKEGGRGETEKVVGTPKQPQKKVSTKDAWNGSMTSLVIFGCLFSTLGLSSYFALQLLEQTPAYIGATLTYLLQGPSIPPYPNPASFPIPDFGMRHYALSQLAAYRPTLLSLLDSKVVSQWYPDSNVTALDVVEVAYGGWTLYESAQRMHRPPVENFTTTNALDLLSKDGERASMFLSKFPQTSEAIVLAATGRSLGALMMVGPAVGEVRWMGAEAFVEGSSSSSVVEKEEEVGKRSKESLDPTTELPGILVPILLDGLFASIVFFGTLGVLVQTDSGTYRDPTVERHLTALFRGLQLPADPIIPPSKTPTPWTQLILTSPLHSSLRLNLTLLLLRTLLLTELVHSFLLPTSARPLKALMPFVAFISTLAPAVPPMVTVGIPTAVSVWVFYGAPLRALLVLAAHLYAAGTVEAAVTVESMGDDGIAILDAFATWMGWFRFGAPVGLIVGPWSLLGVRRASVGIANSK
ncbi:hypothetical protein HDV05_002208 [Chytridiales sp. JEL 0842]|nr:hypothetical protein HDV05_002208 [Chytridiales sp. JEL 0842]